MIFMERLPVKNSFLSLLASKKVLALVCIGIGISIQAFVMPFAASLAEQIGSSPESGVESRLQQAYQSVTDQGYGLTSVPEWTHDWGSRWNRIMAAASWTPGGDVQPSEVLLGKTYFTSNRAEKTGTLDLTDFSQINLYQGLENNTHWTETEGFGTWTELQATGGTPSSVTANGSTLTLTSTQVMQDNRTKLIWTDSTTTITQNNFTWVAGDNRANPTGNSCNFNSTGTANQWCNVSNFSSPDYDTPSNNVQPGNQAKTGVSANEFCLNLAANDGSGVKTDWRLPTQREILVALLNGANNNLPQANRYHWTSSEGLGPKAGAWYVNVAHGAGSTNTKAFTVYYVRCVRG